MISITQLKDALAVTGAVTVVAFLAFIGGDYVGRRGIEQRIAASDSVQIAAAQSHTDSIAGAAVRARLDSALAGWAAAKGRVDTVRKPVPVPGKPDTIRVPSDNVAAPAILELRIDSITRAGDAVAKACTALANDCAQVRAARDSLAVALARTRAALTAPPTFWQRWHKTVGGQCTFALDDHRLHCGPGVGFSYTW